MAPLATPVQEREWRAKERAAAERQAAMQRELSEARSAQQNSKLKQRADMAQVEHEDFMRVLAVNRAREQEDMAQVRGQEAVSRQEEVRGQEEVRRQEDMAQVRGRRAWGRGWELEAETSRSRSKL